MSLGCGAAQLDVTVVDTALSSIGDSLGGGGRDLTKRRAGGGAALERSEIRMNRHHALGFCLRMISAQTLRVCREEKTATFRILG
jgi:hypothetical protein